MPDNLNPFELQELRERASIVIQLIHKMAQEGAFNLRFKDSKTFDRVMAKANEIGWDIEEWDRWCAEHSDLMPTRIPLGRQVD